MNTFTAELKIFNCTDLYSYLKFYTQIWKALIAISYISSAYYPIIQIDAYLLSGSVA
jgi:hypothetical protein